MIHQPNFFSIKHLKKKKKTSGADDSAVQRNETKKKKNLTHTHTAELANSKASKTQVKERICIVKACIKVVFLKEKL